VTLTSKTGIARFTPLIVLSDMMGDSMSFSLPKALDCVSVKIVETGEILAY
jgi:hypothetical protein